MPYRTYQLFARASVTTLAGIAVAMGTALLVGGRPRFTSPGFTVARELPGDVYSWGILVLLFGIIILAGVWARWHRKTIMLGIFCLCTWFTFFAITIGLSAMQQPTAALTGPVGYGGLAMWCAHCWVNGHLLASVGPRIPPIEE